MWNFTTSGDVKVSTDLHNHTTNSEGAKNIYIWHKLNK